ncbi:MAG: HEAT repeat domain-containing protein [Desulfomonilia bacterium]
MKGVVLNQILRDLHDAEPEIKKMAAKAILKETPDPAQVFSSVLKDADKPTAGVVYDILFDADADFSDIFRAATQDEDPRVRARAIRYLFRKGAFRPEDGIKWLEDPDAYVRRRVISYLFWLNDKSSLGSVARLCTKDPDESVRKDCLRLMAIWGSPDDVEQVIKALEDPSHEVRMQAVQTLKRLTGEDFGEPLSASPEEFEWIIAKWQGWWEIMMERS